MYLFVLISAMVSLMSRGTTSPRYSMQQAIYLPARGLHFIMQFDSSKQLLVISLMDVLSCMAFSLAIIGANEINGKWMRG